MHDSFRELGIHHPNTVDFDECSGSKITKIIGWENNFVLGLQIFYDGIPTSARIGSMSTYGMNTKEFNIDSLDQINQIFANVSTLIEKLTFSTIQGKSFTLGTGSGTMITSISIPGKCITRLKMGVGAHLDYLGAYFDSISPSYGQGSGGISYQFADNPIPSYAPYQGSEAMHGPGMGKKLPAGFPSIPPPAYAAKDVTYGGYSYPSPGEVAGLPKAGGEISAPGMSSSGYTGGSEYGPVGYGVPFPSSGIGHPTHMPSPMPMPMPVPTSTDTSYPSLHHASMPISTPPHPAFTTPISPPPLMPPGPSLLPLPSSNGWSECVGLIKTSSQVFDDYQQKLSSYIDQSANLRIVRLKIQHNNKSILGFKINYTIDGTGTGTKNLLCSHRGSQVGFFTKRVAHIMEKNEHITQITGKIDLAKKFITKLAIFTNKGKVLDCGGDSGTEFWFTAPTGKKFIAFGGAYSENLDALKAFYIPI